MTTLRTHTYLTLENRDVVPPIRLVMLRLGRTRKKGERMTRDQLLEDLRWLAEGNPRYAGTNEEGQQNIAIAHLMASDFLLSYINDQEVTGLLNKIRRGYSS